MQSKVSLPILTRKGNWVAWETKITAYLSLKCPLISKFLTNPPDATNADGKEQDRRCRSFLILHVNDDRKIICVDDLAADIRSSITAHASYKILKNILLHEKEVRGQILNQKISSLPQGVRSSDDYVREVQSLMIEAQDLGEPTYMRNICSQLILGLAPAAKNVLLDNLMTLIERNLSSNSTPGEIKSIFHTMESRIRARSHMLSTTSQQVQDDTALMFAAQGGGAAYHQPHATPGPSHPPTTPKPPVPQLQPDRPFRSDANERAERVCYWCNKPGHMKRNGRQFKADMQRELRTRGMNSSPQQHRPSQEHAPGKAMHVGQVDIQRQLDAMQQQLRRLTAAGLPADEADLPNGAHVRMYSTRAVCNSVSQKSDPSQIWLDGGSTHHVVSQKMVLFNMTASHINEVVVAGGECHAVTCCGSMTVQTDVRSITFHQVLCVPTFIVNQLSVPQLDHQGYKIVHGHQSATIIDENEVSILTGELQNGLYILNCRIRWVTQVHAMSNDVSGTTLKLLHRRLGHPGMRATRELLNGNAVLGLMHDLHACEEDYCEVCRNSKEHRAHFAPSSHKCTQPLQLIHSDLMGPLKCPSSGGHLYTCTLYDHYSGFGEVFLLKAKSEVNVALRKAIYLWQRQTSCKVKTIRTDRGKEYEGDFQAFLRTEGIIHQRSAACTPEQNGVAERYNRTLIERMRALLNESHVPTFLWGEAAKTAAPKTGQKLYRMR
jgi:transposase InsO family protein